MSTLVPISFIVLSHTASVLLTVSPMVFSSSTGPDWLARN